MTPQDKIVAKRVMEAYLRMAREARYRPAAPGDGVGGIHLTDEQLQDDELLSSEALQYAMGFLAQEHSCQFFIGRSSFATNRALVFTLEAARLLCAHQKDLAATLLNMALNDLSPEEYRHREQPK